MPEKTLEDLTESLDEKYFVFKWTDRGRHYEGSCLAVYQLKERKLVGVLNYDKFDEEMEYEGDRFSEDAVLFFNENDIREVYTVFCPPQEFLGITSYEDDPDIVDEHGAVTDWSEIDGLCRDCELSALLARAGIRVNLVGYEDGKIYNLRS